MIQETQTPVRLSDSERKIILNAVIETATLFGVDWSVISLFGSRTNLQTRGGDIDLYIRLLKSQSIDQFAFKKNLVTTLKSRLGDQKIDMVIDDGTKDLGAFGAMINSEKVDLWTKK